MAFSLLKYFILQTRKDIIFFIQLYQRYIYRIDMKRVNEFGTYGEAPTEEVDAINTNVDGEKQLAEANFTSTHPKSE
jgi:hypothetical protein